MRDSRFDCLFQPLTLGPVVAPNRFYQVPHCSGMGWRRPNALAAMRAMKAEGGWGVVCTEYCSVHPTSDDEGFPYAALWSVEDIRAQALMTEAVHAHGALAGAELWLGGAYTANLASRLPSIGLRSNAPVGDRHMFPAQSRRADRDDIRALRRWHAAAARRAVEAGFDIVYVYATHGYLLSEFLDGATNDRTDEYGGSLENRVRLVRELIEETREAVAGRAAVATRFSVDLGAPESYDAFGLLADLPDLWDLTVADYDVEMGGSRFVGQSALQDSVAAAKKLTSRPVVAVGRFTSPDAMAAAIRSGGQDMIGAARPSIADPFLPRKIEEGRLDDIRECIGCNICYAHNSLNVPIRCTQNPTMGEEWRRGWHPERVAPAPKSDQVLIVGAGPAGLEAARALGERGYRVMLAEASRELGGRVNRECRLPGLAEWARVRDWRLGQLTKLPSVEVFRESPMAAADVRDAGAPHVLIATGARWSTDGVGSWRDRSIAAGAAALSVDALLDGAQPQGRVLIYDDDHYYLGPCLALHLRRLGADVAIVTPAGRVGQWSGYTEELFPTNRALIEAGVELIVNHALEAFDGAEARIACVFSGRERAIAADHVTPVTRRDPDDALYRALAEDGGFRTLRRIGDCEAPSILAGAVYSGYRAALELGDERDLDLLYARREHASLNGTEP